MNFYSTEYLHVETLLLVPRTCRNLRVIASKTIESCVSGPKVGQLFCNVRLPAAAEVDAARAPFSLSHFPKEKKTNVRRGECVERMGALRVL